MRTACRKYVNSNKMSPKISKHVHMYIYARTLHVVDFTNCFICKFSL